MSFLKFHQIALTILLLATVPAIAAEDTLSDKQKQEVRDVVREYLREKPEILVEAIRALQAKKDAMKREQAQTSLESLRGELENDPSSPIGGNPKGDVTVVEFFDYRCGFCKRALPAIIELLASDDQIRYVFREFPILGDASKLAARAALAVWNIDKEKYMPFHTALMESKGELSEEKILGIANKVGLNEIKLLKVMKDPNIEKTIQRNYALGDKLGITGTPAFIIGDLLGGGIMSLEAMKNAVKKARDKKG